VVQELRKAPVSFGRRSTETLLTDLMLGQRKKGARIVDFVTEISF